MEEKERQFMTVTGRSRIDARRFLEISGGDLEGAIALSFDQPSSTGIAGAALTERDIAPPPQPKPSMPESWGKPQKKKGGFRTMRDVAAHGSDDEDDDTQRYVSHDGQSGRFTIDPSKKNRKVNPDDLFGQLQEKAEKRTRDSMREEYGDEHDDGEDGDGRAGARVGEKTAAAPDWSSRGGTSLGGKTSPSTPVGGSSPSPTTGTAPPRKEKKLLKLTMYRDGFSIDGGRLYPLDDPQAKEDLKVILSGRVPQHLLPPGFTGDISLALEDKRGEDAPKPPRDYFSEPGNALSTGGSAPKPKVMPPPVAAPPASAPQPTLAELSGSDTFMIQCRFEESPPQKFVFNPRNTLTDLEKKAKDHLKVKFVELAQPMPRKVFGKDDMHKTLVDLGLKNASIIVRVV